MKTNLFSKFPFAFILRFFVVSPTQAKVVKFRFACPPQLNLAFGRDLILKAINREKEMRCRHYQDAPPATAVVSRNASIHGLRNRDKHKIITEHQKSVRVYMPSEHFPKLVND